MRMKETPNARKQRIEEMSDKRCRAKVWGKKDRDPRKSRRESKALITKFL